jgi:hypothetical protein
MRWARRVGMAVVGVLAVTGLAKAVIEIRDRADPVDVDALAASFEEETLAGPGRLSTGLWAYNAGGSENIDLLGGALHEFPPVVAQSVVDTPCGQTIDVQLFEQRRDTLELCRDDQGRLVFDRLVTQHEFVGVRDVTSTSECDPVPVWWPGIEPVPTGETSSDCRSSSDMAGDIASVVRHRVLGRDEVRVGDVEVPAVHVRLTCEVGTHTDATRGSYAADLWFGIEDPVILRRTLDARVDSDTPLGRVRLEEQFDIVVQSLTPRTG